MKKQRFSMILMLVLISVTFISCVPSGYGATRAGFFYGLWHGFIILFTLIGKLLGFKVGLYALNNTGFTYWLGFIIGIGAFGGGGSRARR